MVLTIFLSIFAAFNIGYGIYLFYRHFTCGFDGLNYIACLLFAAFNMIVMRMYVKTVQMLWSIEGDALTVYSVGVGFGFFALGMLFYRSLIPCYRMKRMLTNEEIKAIKASTVEKAFSVVAWVVTGIATVYVLPKVG